MRSTGFSPRTSQHCNADTSRERKSPQRPDTAVRVSPAPPSAAIQAGVDSKISRSRRVILLGFFPRSLAMAIYAESDPANDIHLTFSSYSTATRKIGSVKPWHTIPSYDWQQHCLNPGRNHHIISHSYNNCAVQHWKFFGDLTAHTKLVQTDNLGPHWKIAGVWGGPQDPRRSPHSQFSTQKGIKLKK